MRSRLLAMAAMDGGVVYFCHGGGCGVVVVVGYGKKRKCPCSQKGDP